MIATEAKSLTRLECCEGEQERLVWVRDLATRGATSTDPEMASRTLGLIFYLFVIGDLEKEEWGKPVVKESTVDPEVIDVTRTFLGSIRDIAGEAAKAADPDTVFRVAKELCSMVQDGVVFKHNTYEVVDATAVKDCAEYV